VTPRELEIAEIVLEYAYESNHTAGPACLGLDDEEFTSEEVEEVIGKLQLVITATKESLK
jgi:hypothetical protein